MRQWAGRHLDLGGSPALGAPGLVGARRPLSRSRGLLFYSHMLLAKRLGRAPCLRSGGLPQYRRRCSAFPAMVAGAGRHVAPCWHVRTGCGWTLRLGPGASRLARYARLGSRAGVARSTHNGPIRFSAGRTKSAAAEPTATLDSPSVATVAPSPRADPSAAKRAQQCRCPDLLGASYR